jgi:O-antigen/teichoic acid export membrane protein
MFTPVYIKILGVEAFGIITITLSIQIVIYMIDLGFGGAVVLETAALAAQQKYKELYNLFRTGEVLYWAICLILLCIFLFFSDLIAYTWLSHVPPDQFNLKMIILLIAGIVIGQWPSIFYSGALMGMQRQDLLNAVQIVVATVKGLGSIGVLLFISPTLEAFLLTHMLGSFLQTLGLALYLWKVAKGGFFLGRFDKQLLAKIVKKAGKISLHLILITLLFHIDKMILSRFLDLTAFGYYCFSWTFVTGMYSLCLVLTMIFTPRFSHHLALQEEKELVFSYHQGCQWVGVTIIPITVFFLFFSNEMLLYWCKDPILTERASLTSMFLVLGTCFLCLYSIPQNFQMANNWTSLTILMAAAALLVYVSLLIASVHYWGLKGAALCWPVLHFFYLLIYMHLMFKKMLVKEKMKWVLEDIFMPFLGALAVCAAGKCFFTPYLKGSPGLFLLGLIALASVLATALMSTIIRSSLVKFIARRLKFVQE